MSCVKHALLASSQTRNKRPLRTMRRGTLLRFDLRAHAAGAMLRPEAGGAPWGAASQESRPCYFWTAPTRKKSKRSPRGV